MNKEAVLKKVEKLMRMQESPNKEEAETAAIMMQKLVQKYNIDVGMINLIEEDKELVKEYSLNSGRKKVRPWMTQLIAAVAKFYDVRALIRGRHTYILVGFEVDSKVAKQMYEYLYDSLMREARNDSKEVEDKKYRKRWKLSYLLGAAVELDRRFHAIKESQKAKSDCTDLVVVKEDKIKDFIASMDIKDGRNRKTNIDAEAYAMGEITGQTISLNQQIN